MNIDRGLSALIISLAVAFGLAGSARAQSVDAPPQTTQRTVPENGFATPDLDPARRARVEASAVRGIEITRIQKEARALLSAGHPLDAIKKYQEWLKVDSSPFGGAGANVAIGDILDTLRRYPEAVAMYDKLWITDGGGRRFNAGNTEIIFRYVVLLCRAKRYDDAFTAYNLTQASDPILFTKGQYGIPFDAKVDETNYTTGYLEHVAQEAVALYCLETSRYEEAISRVHFALAINPHSAMAYYLLGRTLNECPQSLRESNGGTRAEREAYEKAVLYGTGRIVATARKSLAALPE